MKNKTSFFSVMSVGLLLPIVALGASEKVIKSNSNKEKLRMAITQTAKEKSQTSKQALPFLGKKRTAINSSIQGKSKAKPIIAGPHKVKRQAAINLPEVRGLQIYNSYWEYDDAPMGVYQIYAEGSLEEVFVPNSIQGNTGIIDNDMYWVTGYNEMWGMIVSVFADAYDVETGEKLASFEYDGSALDKIFMDFTIASDGTYYAVGWDAAGSGLELKKVSFSLSDGVSVTSIGALDGNFNSIAIDAEGQLYGITIDGDEYEVYSSTLVKIDKETCEVTKVGETGMLPQYISSSEFDLNTNTLYWTVAPPENTAYLTTIDTSTGAATVICELDGAAEITGLYIRAPAASEGAPAAAEDLTAEFIDGSLTGNVTFKAPSKTFGGEAASGNLTYKILANGVEVGNGTTTCGETVNASVTVPQSGNYTIAVTTENEEGVSPKAKITLFIGYGTPEATEAELTYEDGKMILIWDAVTATVDGGYMNPEEVTYSVVKNPGAEEVYRGKDTSYTETITEPEQITHFYYTVCAESDGLVSAAATSNAITLGSIIPPYFNDFESAMDLGGFTIIDANEDGVEWRWAGDAVMIRYSYDNMDDWLITPAMKLDAGKLYKVSFRAYAQSDGFPETIEAAWGDAPTPSAMTNRLLEPTVVSMNGSTFSYYVCPDSSGSYYLGIHGISEADQYFLYIDNIEISAPMSADVPAAVTNLTATPNPNGDYTATISFNAPSTSMDNKPLNDLTKIEVSCNGVIVKTFESPTSGELLSFSDEVNQRGTYTYKVVPYNEAGVGQDASVSVYVGTDSPEAPQNIRMVETGNTGYVTLTWDPVSTDYKGRPINPAKVTYLVAEPDGYGYVVPIVEGLTETSYSFQAVPEGKQEFVQYAVFASTEGGDNGAYGPLEAIGTPYNEFEESFDNGQINNQLIVGFVSDEGSWKVFTDAEMAFPDADGTNGFAGMYGPYYDSSAALITPKISITTMVNPFVSLYTYNVIDNEGHPDTNEIEVYVKEVGTEEWLPLGKASTVDEICEGNPEIWHNALFSLEAYKGKDIQVRFQATTRAYVYTLLDDLKVGDIVMDDVSISKISAPKKVKAGNDYKVEVTVVNKGTENASDISVLLYAEGKEVASQHIEALEVGVSKTLSFPLTMSEVATEAVELFAKVEYADDKNDMNDVSDNIYVEPIISKYPSINDLKASEDNGGILLNWTAPDLANIPSNPGMVDFEDGEAGAMEYEGWTFVDADGIPVGGFQGIDIPGITPDVTTASFFIVDASSKGFNDALAGHSGDKYLAALYRSDDGQTDDWAISPLLTGNRQTVSFYAQSISGLYPEKIEFYYSTGSLDIKDFEQIGETIYPVPEEWTEYRFELPEGAKYFAVRSCAEGSFMLMMDDFTFIAASDDPSNLEIIGYEIYRDGEEIATVSKDAISYVDEEGTKESIYVVLVEYTVGLSAPSNEASANGLGIENVSDSVIKVKAGKGYIVITGAEGLPLSIITTQGVVVYNSIAKDYQHIELAKGIYILKAGKNTIRVAVK